MANESKKDFNAMMKNNKDMPRNIVDSFIKDIFVNNEKGVDIIFRYKDEYENAERYLKSKNNVI